MCAESGFPPDSGHMQSLSSTISTTFVFVPASQATPCESTSIQSQILLSLVQLFSKYRRLEADGSIGTGTCLSILCQVTGATENAQGYDDVQSARDRIIHPPGLTCINCVMHQSVRAYTRETEILCGPGVPRGSERENSCHKLLSKNWTRKGRQVLPCSTK